MLCKGRVRFSFFFFYYFFLLFARGGVCVKGCDGRGHIRPGEVELCIIDLSGTPFFRRDRRKEEGRKKKNVAGFVRREVYLLYVNK